MKAFIAALFIAASASAETIIIPVQDLMFEVPNFTNAPKFELGAALNGNFVPETPKRMDRKTKRELEKKLISMMWDEYPDAQSIRIWNGNMIVRMP
jgi:hypothetical protein